MKRLLLLVLLPLLSFPLFAQNPDLRGLKTVVSKLGGDAAVVGKQYAVLIAIDKYKAWMALRNPVKDAKEIKDILSRRYYFSDFIELYDEAATKADIIKLFNKLISSTKPEDSVLIFYAGHGYLDKSSNLGFWIPVDGGMDVDEQANWLPNAQVRGFISNMKARHVALIADSCFSGDILNPTRGMAPTITSEYFKNAYARISRQVLTSGASESVPDESQFTQQLKLALEGNTSPYLDPLMLYNQIRLGVTQTTPLFGDLKDSGHQQGSSFLFFLKNKQSATAEAASKKQSQASFELAVVTANVDIETKTTGTLLLDGVVQGQVPAGRVATIKNLEAGSHELVMQYDNGETEKIGVNISSGEPLSIKFTNVFLLTPARSAGAVKSEATPSTEQPAEADQAALLGDRSPLPPASIAIDGNFDDWSGIPPAFFQGPSLKEYLPTNLAIDKVYLAVDAQYLYMRLDVMDRTPSSPSRPYNFQMDNNCSYGLVLENGMNLVVVQIDFDKQKGYYYAEMSATIDRTLKTVDRKSGKFALKGSSLEASFPLELIRKYLGPTPEYYNVTAQTQLYDSEWSADQNVNDRTETKQFSFPQAPTNDVSKDRLSDGDHLPKASIKIDGNFDDWKGILPAFSQAESPSADSFFNEIYLAMDATNLYMRIDIRDMPYHSLYGLDLENGINHVVAEVRFDKDSNHWFVEVGNTVGQHIELMDGTSGYCSIKGQLLEAAFPLGSIRKKLGAQESFRVTARTGYSNRQWSWVEGDRSVTKHFTF